MYKCVRVHLCMYSSMRLYTEQSDSRRDFKMMFSVMEKRRVFAIIRLLLFIQIKDISMEI